MDPKNFHGARLKIERSNQHIRDIEARIVALHKTNVSRVEIHPQFGTERLVHEFTDATAFDDLALLLGDAVHNLNSALDYVWWHTARRLIPTVVNDRTKLPVRETFKELEGWFKSPGKKHPAIDTISPELSDFILNKVRPYRGGNPAIWPIHVLDNIDKHRLLITILSAGDINGIEVVDEDGESWQVSGIGTIQEPPYVIDLNPGLHFKEQGKLSAWILVNDGKLARQLRLPLTLFNYSDLILKVVEAFETFNETMP
jgi:hypothetical protein